MKFIFVFLFIGYQSMAATINLQAGSSATIQPDTSTLVTCAGSGNLQVMLYPGIFKPTTGNRYYEISDVKYENQSVKSFNIRSSSGPSWGSTITCEYITCGNPGYSQTTIIAANHIVDGGVDYYRQ